ncbi:MAG TPA: PLP-dependent aminotransferase family protein [Aquihabitans sp.]|jgi:2-aminoadipate transaminase|nr:PLP-dependent aminotransferase family protein [Aquihabitans sp.]
MATDPRAQPASPAAAHPHGFPTGDAIARTGSSAIRDLLEITEQPGVLSLAGGLPSPEGFPVAAFERASAAVLGISATGALQYGTTEGHRPLREWVAGRYGSTPDGVVVTHGSQQALDLLARATTRAGDPVVLADPGYIGAIQAFRAAGADLVGVPADHDGLRVDVLEDRLADGLRPTLVYVVANFDNPSGATLGEDRRRRLADLADRYGFLVVEDDPYGQLRWRGEAPTALRSLTDRCLSLGTVSKVLSPGLRVGWAVGPPPVVRSMVVLKQAADLHTSSLTQHLVHHVLTEPGFLDDHLAGLRTRYRAQAEALVAALRDVLGDAFAFAFAQPDGGMFVWGDVSSADGAPVDTAALLPVAVARGMAFVPGTAFSVSEPHRSAMRLSFATGTPAELAEGVARLAAALADVATADIAAGQVSANPR